MSLKKYLPGRKKSKSLMGPEMKGRRLKFLALNLILMVFLSPEKLLNSEPEFSETETSVISFPLRVRDSLPVEGRIIDLVAGSDHRIFWLTESGKITGYNWLEKRVIWNFHLPAKPLTRLLAVGEIILAVDKENNLLALSLEGRLIWPETLASFGGQIIFFEGKLALSLADGSLLVLKPETGEVVWRSSTKAKLAALTVSPENVLLAIAETGQIYQFSSEGRADLSGFLEATILPYVSLSGDLLFLGTQDKKVIAWNLKKKKKAWSIELGGRLVTLPLFARGNLYLATSNAVIYCLKAKSGEIKWWQSIPSRLAFNLVLASPYLIVATENPPLLAFDLMTGRKAGEFRPEGEICTSPLLVPGGLILSVYETVSGQSSLLFLEPEIRVALSSSLPSPQKVGTEITFTAEAVGFEAPRYEFFLQKGESREIVQKESARNSWTWLPLSPGDYLIGVRVKDKGKTREATLSFQISQERPENFQPDF